MNVNSVILDDIINNFKISGEDVFYDRILLRYNIGWDSETQIRKLLNNKMELIIKRYQKLVPYRSLFGEYLHSEKITINKLENSITTASICYENRQYEEAVRQLKSCENYLNNLEKLLIIIKNYQKVIDLKKHLLSLINESFFNEISTLIMIDKLLLLIEINAQKGNLSKAKLHLRICMDELYILNSQTNEIDKINKLRRKIYEIPKLFDKLKSEAKERLLPQIGIVTHLIDKGYLALAEQILDEIEMKFGGVMAYDFVVSKFPEMLSDNDPFQSCCDESTIHMIEESLKANMANLKNFTEQNMKNES